MTNKIPTPPTGLGTAGRALWRKLHAELPTGAEFDEREVELLTQAAHQRDDIGALERAVKKHGHTVRGSTGQPRVNPAVAELRQARLALRRLLDGIELEPPDAVRQMQSQRARQAVGARWAKHRARSERARRVSGGSVD
jgi:phage terminase small subunit